MSADISDALMHLAGSKMRTSCPTARPAVISWAAQAQRDRKAAKTLQDAKKFKLWQRESPLRAPYLAHKVISPLRSPLRTPRRTLHGLRPLSYGMQSTEERPHKKARTHKEVQEETPHHDDNKNTLTNLSAPRFGREMTPDERDRFNADLCKFIIMCNMAWWAVDIPFTRYFFSEWMGTTLPRRQDLSGKILNCEVDKVELEMVKQTHHRFGTGQCDGWKNIKKEAIIATTINVEHTVCTLFNHGIICHFPLTILIIYRAPTALPH
jgi:hypothetical protein